MQTPLRDKGGLGELETPSTSGAYNFPGSPCQPRPLGQAAAELAADLRFRHKVARLCERGDRLVAELLAHIAADRALATYIETLLDRYIGIPDEVLDLLDGRDLPPAPLHEVSK